MHSPKTFARINKLGKIKGYYSLTQILLVLVFMMLARIRSVEQLRGYAPGEFGKLIGLDRNPASALFAQ